MTTPLITRLEEAAEGSRVLDIALAMETTHVYGFDSEREIDAYPHPTTSIDDALALGERLHPCWSWSVGQNVHHKYWRAYALALDTDRAAFQPTEATSKTPALAICIAILRANTRTSHD